MLPRFERKNAAGDCVVANDHWPPNPAVANDLSATFGGERSTTAELDRLVERMERDEFDLIAVGRALIANPQWVEVRENHVADLKGFELNVLAELV
jgi:2,4-dienoyl-CoA reductase-like NADH-dependent reductase (Old Yellow Enzyme family)